MLKTAPVARVCAAVFLVFVIWVLSGWPYGTARVAIGDLSSLLLSSAATVFTALAAWSAQGRSRAAWGVLCVGLLCWAVGDAIWAYYELVLGTYPFPSPADGAYLVMPVAACVAMLLFPTRQSAESQARMILDGVIVAGSLFIVLWLTLLRSVYEAGAESRLALVTSLAYPVLDLIMLTVAAYVAVRPGSYQRLPLTLLAIAMTFFAVTDSAFAYLSAADRYVSGNVIDIGWAASLLLIIVAAAAAAARESGAGGRESVELPSWASVVLPYGPLMAAGIVAAAQPFLALQSVPVLLAVGVLVVAVLARQFLVVGERRRMVADAAAQALRDPLTGLANRDLFHDRLDHAMQFFRRDGLTVGVIVIDLNDFKLVNDSLGHAVGDELLTLVGRRIRGCVRLADTVARLGSDEFAVLVEDEVDYAFLTAQRVVEAFDEPFVIAGRNLLMRPSVGLALAQPGQPDLSAEELFQQANRAMSSAKRSRIPGVTTFTDDLAEDSDHQVLHGSASEGVGGGAEMLRLLGELRHAIDHSELDLAYQPQFDLATGKIVGVEALLRWPHPTRGMLGPEEFLPLVRRHGLMGAVTAFVLGRALDGAVRWHAVDATLPVAINFFAPSIVDLRLPDQIAHALAERGLGADALTVEVTEDLFVANIVNARIVLNRLRERGTRVSVDDFGSGYSALSYLRDLPIDEVKLDREFVASVLADPRAAAVVSAVVNLARALGLTTVMEGVETAEVAAVLKDLGCDVGQGYYFSPPLTLEELLEVLSADGATGSVSAAARSS